ncbi:MAG: hypothetical protein IPN54_01620 [Bacteroidetes bacterium]|nr:hypothetical protein [Bacteroidota bacterium]
MLRLGLFDLLAPQYLVGIQLPQQVQNYLSLLRIDELNSFYDSRFVVYTGTASFEGDGSGSAEVVHTEPSGSRFTWEKKNLHFRMMVPRDGAEFVDRAANSSTNGKLPQVAALLNDLRPQPDSDMDDAIVEIVDFPAVSFRLELLVDILNFSLGDAWKPGIIDPSSNRVKIDPARPNERVVISLPKVLLSYTQGDDANNLNPQVNIESWGVSGFDAPQDLDMGELIRMNPAIAVHQSEHIAFSIDQVVIDNSTQNTPANIIDHFGVDENWRGLYIGQALLYYSNDQGLGFNLRFNDALISFDGAVSFEAALDIYISETLSNLTATPTFYNGDQRVTGLRRGVIVPPVTSAPSGTPPGNVSVQQGAVMHLELSGGMPPYTIQVLDNGSNVWDNATRRATFNNVGERNVFVSVADSSVGTVLRSSEYIKVNVQAAAAAIPPQGTSADNPPSGVQLENLQPFNIVGNDANHELIIENAAGSDIVSLRVRGAEPFTVNINGGTSPQSYTNQRNIQINVPNDSNLAVALNFPARSADELPNIPEINFTYNRPSANSAEMSSYSDSSSDTGDSNFSSSWNAAIDNFPASAEISSIHLEGWASHDPSGATADLRLSERRNTVVENRLHALFPAAAITKHANGHNNLPYANHPDNRMVRIKFTSIAVAQHDITATIVRPAHIPGNPTPVTPPSSPPTAPGLPNDIPPVLKQLGIRVKVEMGKLSLLELYGEIDFQTELEDKLNDAATESGSLEMSNDGLVEFKLIYQYDQATSETTLIFKLNADANDADGLTHMVNNENRDDRLKNIFGALLLFAPIINSSSTAVGNNPTDPGAWISLAVGLGVPITIGGMNVFRTRKIILHGGEARTRFVTPAPGEPLRSLDLGLVFDYEVQFDIVCEQLEIGIDRLPGASNPLPPPLRARYKAIGFNLNYSDTPSYKGLTYTPVFDASRGYDLDLSDPSLFRLPDPLGQLFAIVGARIARFNPVTLELDFAIKVDLGIITVDRFKLKIPLDPAGPPQILPSGVRVNIPGVIIGSGFVEIIDGKVQVPNNPNNPNDGFKEIDAKGIQGGVDITLVSLKIRIGANLGVGTLKDPATKREAISVFLGLRVEFPTPIILGATGLGIYGFLGVFAMHYRRLEPAPDPTSAVGPALRWLINAGGDPTKLRNGTTPLWGMALDRWSFGVGVLMGTAEGGFIVNMQGMFVLELPGPRILIMVKAQIITLLPSNPAQPATELQVGIIGIVDIDFGRGQLTLGVMLNFSIEQVLAITLPIELYFNWNNPSDWHLWLGTISQPASATILDIVRGSAYLMIQGNELDYSKFGNRVPQFLRNKKLQGIAIAVGLEAAILLGSEGAGVYLKIAAGCHFGVSFSPFLVVGNMYFEGKLRLIILSIGARGSFDVLVSQISGTNDLKVYIHGEVCGSIDLFFFEISACIGLSIGDETFDVEPPKLVRGVYLQSFSPVLTNGQGTQRPIDASLGTAHNMKDGPLPVNVLTVPIDSVPVIQMHAAPLLDSSFEANSFVKSPGTYSGTGGSIQLSDEVKINYTLKSVTLLENNSTYSDPEGKPPSVWRIDRPQNGSPTDTSIDLACFSRVPTTAPHAIERSTELNTNVTVRWEDACKNPAPPSPVLFTFCEQKIGYSANGWTLTGIPKPDPDGTVRTQPVNNVMRIYEPQSVKKFGLFDVVLSEAGYGGCNAAKVLGIDKLNANIPPSREQQCFKLIRKIKSFETNPLLIDKSLKIYSASEKRSILNNKSGLIKYTQLKPFESTYRTQFGQIKETIGLSIKEYMRIDIMGEAVDEVSINFSSFNSKAKEESSLIFYAYDEEGVLLIKEIFVDKSRKEDIHTIVLKAENIKHLILYNKNFTGHLVEICYSRDKNANINKFKDFLRCFRTLQLPYCSKPNEKKQEVFSDLIKPDAIKEYYEKNGKNCCIIFETGACESILFYGALLKVGKKFNIEDFSNGQSNAFAKLVMVEELDSNNNVLKTYKLLDLIVDDNVIPATDLPADWMNAGLPWRPKMLPTAAFLHSGYFNSYTKILFLLKPKSEKTCRIRICNCIPQVGFPILLISAIETLQLSEVQHHAQVSEMLETEQETLTGYLNGNSPVPLLKPNKVYRMLINYEATVETRKKVTDPWELKKTRDITEEFAFKTDNTPPLPLSPYVLGTLPIMDEPFHFYRDPLMVVFNDNAFLKMYQAYGKQLKAIIRGADGLPVFNSPEIVNSLTEIPAEVKTPYREAIEAMIAAGLLPCMGEMSFPTHAQYSPPFELKPLMPYTFDIEFDPKDAVPSTGSEQPLFRRAFKTSRFANVEEFVDSIASQAIKHKALQSAITGLPVPIPGPQPSVHTLSDVEFENMLLSAGIAPKDANETTSITLCWSNNSGDFAPHSLLIDASEPIWRQRIEAVKQTLENAPGQQLDPAFKIYENTAMDSMVLKAKAGENKISHFVKTTAGTRTLIVFKNTPIPTAGIACNIMIEQLASSFYSMPAKLMPLVTIQLSNKAPWED